MDYFNPYGPPANGFNPYRTNLPHYEVIKVNGRAGVDAFQMAPNSSVLLLDTTANIVWFVQTDGAGYKTPVPFDISPHVEPPTIDAASIMDKLKAMEQEIAVLREEARNNGEFNTRPDGRKNNPKQRNCDNPAQ